MRIVDRIRFKETMAPVPDGTEVHIRLLDDNSHVGTATTSNGYFEFTMNGYPGPVYYTATVGDETFEHSSLSVGPAQGVQIGELQQAMRAIGDGIVDGVGNQMAVTPAASGLKVNVSNGVVLGDGIIHQQYTTQEVTFSPDASVSGTTNSYPLVVRFYSRDSSGERFKTELLAYDKPTLDIVEQIALSLIGVDVQIATVRIAPGATSLTSSDITMTEHRAGEFEIDDIAGIEDAIWEAIRDGINVGAALTKSVDEANQVITLDAAAGSVEVDVEQLQDAVAAFLKAGSNITLTHNDAANTLTIASSGGGGGSGGGTVYWKDTNFSVPSPETVTGPRNIATATISSLPAGTWFIESQTHFSVYGNGWSIFNTQLTGNGTPQGSDASSRNNDVAQGSWRQVILTGRTRLTLATATDVSATCRVAPVSGSAISMGAGTVFLKAIREA